MSSLASKCHQVHGLQQLVALGPPLPYGKAARVAVVLLQAQREMGQEEMGWGWGVQGHHHE